jgi:predicted nucleic acid-binding protein
MTAKKKAVEVVQKESKEIVPVQNSREVNAHSLIMAAIDKSVPVDVLERLLAMREKIQKEQAEIEFREAISSFQSECPIIPKRKEVFDKNGKLRYRYAPIEDIVKAVQPYLAKNGLSYDIDTEPVQGGIVVVLTVSHVAGHQKVTRFSAPIQSDAYMSDPQKWASASTFAKRYAFCNGFGILTGDEDNDATICDDSAHKPAQEKPAETPPAKQMTVDQAKILFRSAITREMLEKRALAIARTPFNPDEMKELKEVYREMVKHFENNSEA